jgi:serine/threonine protein phosphatase 1
MIAVKQTANPHIARLDANSKGRDFVIGDIHGCLEAVERLLEKSGFERNKDRLICTGDLTHRGPDSLGCLQLLQEPWFLSVRGNHEVNTLDALNLHFGMPTTKTDAFYKLASEGGLWLCELVAKSFSASPKAPLVNQALAVAYHNLQGLPAILLVGNDHELTDPRSSNKNKAFIVAHAGLIRSEEKSSKGFPILWEPEEILAASEGKLPLTSPYLLHESKALGSKVKEMEAEGRLDPLSPETIAEHLPPRVFCGHTPLSKPRLACDHFHLDNGAGKEDRGEVKRHLAMVNVSSGEIWRTRANHPEIRIEPKDYARRVAKALEKGLEIPPLLA